MHQTETDDLKQHAAEAERYVQQQGESKKWTAVRLHPETGDVIEPTISGPSPDRLKRYVRAYWWAGPQIAYEWPGWVIHPAAGKADLRVVLVTPAGKAYYRYAHERSTRLRCCWDRLERGRP